MKKHTLSSMMKAVARKLKAAKLFYGHGTDNPEDEAFALVFQALSLPFPLIDSASSRELKEAEIEKIEALVKERIEKRIPLAYLTHQAYFFVSMSELLFHVLPLVSSLNINLHRG